MLLDPNYAIAGTHSTSISGGGGKEPDAFLSWFISSLSAATAWPESTPEALFQLNIAETVPQKQMLRANNHLPLQSDDVHQCMLGQPWQDHFCIML